MKRFLYLLLFLPLAIFGQIFPQEASTAQTTAGLAGAPYYISPRRMAAYVAGVGGLPPQGGQGGKFLTTDGATASWGTPPGSGTVTSVGFTGGLLSVATATTTPAITVAGTSGGIPYFSAASTWASSGALTANAFIKGGGAGAAPTASLFSDDGTTATYTGTGGVTAAVFTGSGTTPAAVSLIAGSGSIPALTANSAGFAAPTTGGTAYLFKLPGTAIAGVPVFATPATADGVNESAMSIVAPGTSGNVLTSNGSQWVSSAAAGGSGTSNVRSITQANSFTIGQCVFNNNGTWTVSDNSAAATAQVDGTVTTIGNPFTVTLGGAETTITGLAANTVYYLGTSGALTATKPTPTPAAAPTNFLVQVLHTGVSGDGTVEISSPASFAYIGTNDINFGLTADTTTTLTVTTAMDYITNSNAAAVTDNLPTLAAAIAANPTKIYHFKNVGAGAAKITPNGAETIFYTTSGATSLTLNTGEAVELVATATQWLAL